jgi:hypothetical protein
MAFLKLFLPRKLPMADQFVYRKGARHRVPADVAGPVLQQLAEEDRLTTRVVVDESTPEDAPLHLCFEWDDAAAADSWRLKQAGTLIRDVKVIKEASDAGRLAKEHAENAVIMFAGCPDDRRELHYQPIAKLMNDPEGFDQALLHLQSKLSAAQRAFDDLLQQLDTEDQQQLRRIALLREARELNATVRSLAAKL